MDLRRLMATTHGVILGSGAVAGVIVGCGTSNDEGTPPAATDDASPDASVVDVAEAAVPREELATGVRLVARPALLSGITTDGFVVFSDVDGAGHTVAKVIPIDGGEETTIVASSGTGKADLRFATSGKVVFVWADRGSRVASLTVWSKASGVVSKGPNIRPGRAAASDDGQSIVYMRDVTAETASIVVGPISGAATLVGTINAKDDGCWRDVDFASSDARLFARYCPEGSTSFTLRSLGIDGSSADLSTAAASAIYGSHRVVWRETSGAIRSAAADGTGAVTLATGVAEARLSRSEALVAYRTNGGAIGTIAADGGPPHDVVAAGGAARLGAISGNDDALLFASKIEDRGATELDVYTDVQAISLDGGAPVTLVAGTTSCASCLYDSFNADGSRALVIDPIDFGSKAGGVGPARVLDRATGASIATFGAHVVTAGAFGDGGASARFVAIESTSDPTLSSGYAYAISTRGLGASDDGSVVARGTEEIVVDLASSRAVFSFAGSGEHAGIWVAPLP